MTAKQESVDKEVHKSLGKVKYSTYSSFFFLSQCGNFNYTMCRSQLYVGSVQ